MLNIILIVIYVVGWLATFTGMYADYLHGDIYNNIIYKDIWVVIRRSLLWPLLLVKQLVIFTWHLLFALYYLIAALVLFIYALLEEAWLIVRGK